MLDVSLLARLWITSCNLWFICNAQWTVRDRPEGLVALDSRERHADRTQCRRGAPPGAGVPALWQERRGYVLQVWSASVWCSLRLQQTNHDMYTYNDIVVIILYYYHTIIVLSGGHYVIFCAVCPANWKPGQDAMKVSEAGAYFKKHYWAEPSRALLLYKLHFFRFMALCRAQASQTQLIYDIDSLLFAPATRRASIGSALNILPFIVSFACWNHL